MAIEVLLEFFLSYKGLIKIGEHSVAGILLLLLIQEKRKNRQHEELIKKIVNFIKEESYIMDQAERSKKKKELLDELKKIGFEDD